MAFQKLGITKAPQQAPNRDGKRQQSLDEEHQVYVTWFNSVSNMIHPSFIPYKTVILSPDFADKYRYDKPSFMSSPFLNKFEG